VHEAHEAEARAEFDEREAEIAMELAAHLRWSRAQAARELGGADVTRRTQVVDGSTAVHVSRAGTRAQGREEVAELALDRAMITHVAEKERPFTKASHLRLGKDDLFLEHAQTAPSHALRERRAERHDEELEIGARLEEDVILPGLEHHELTGAKLERSITDSDPRRAPHDGVHLRLGVEVAGAAERRLMSPELRGAPGQHREGLK
jgi:hypothetical protein